MVKPGSTNRASKFRGKTDEYPTPLEAIIPFISELKKLTPHTHIWEPACGKGQMAACLRAFDYDVTATGLPDNDFLSEPCLRASVIMTNPPFNIVDDFVLHALDLKPDLACLFLRTKFLEGDKRYKRLLSKRPPRYVYQFVERIVFYSDDAPLEDQPGWNTEAFAWFVWEKDVIDEPKVRWLRRA